MKLIYASHLRVPSELTCSPLIMKTCEQFALKGIDVELWLPRRRNPGFTNRDPFELHGIQHVFTVRRLSVLDLFGTIPDWPAFAVLVITFNLSVWWRLLARRSSRGAVLYAHDWRSVMLPALSRRTLFLEVHDFYRSRFRRLARWMLRRPNGLIVTNRVKMRVMREEFGVPEARLLHQPNAVDPAMFDIAMTQAQARAQLGVPAEGRLIVYTGHLYQWKGADTLVQAAGMLAPDERVYLVGGIGRDVERLRRRSAAPVFIGMRPHAEIPVWLRAADAVVLTGTAMDLASRDETSPVKLFEYLASGAPLIAADMPSIRDLISDDVAWFYQPDDPQSLAQVIQAARRDPILAAQKAAGARRHAQRYTWTVRTSHIMEFLSARTGEARAAASVWMLAAELITAALRALMGVALVRTLAPAVFGQYVYLTALCGLAECAALPGLDRALQRAIVVGSSGSILPARALKRRYAAAGSALLLAFALWHLIQGNAQLAASLAIAAAWFIPDQLVELGRAVLIGRRQFARVCGLTLAEQTAVVASAVFVAARAGALWMVVSVMMGASVAVRAIWCARLRLFRADGAVEPNLHADSRQMSAMGGVFLVAGHAVKLVIGQLMGFSALAVFGAATMIIERLRRLAGFIYIGLMPRFAAAKADDARALARRMLPPLAFGFALLASGVAAAAPWAPRILGPAYAGAVPYLRWLALGLFFDLVSGLFTKSWLPARRGWGMLWRSTLWHALGPVALYAVCLPWWGVSGAVIASVAASAVNALLVLVVLREPAPAAADDAKIRVCHLISRMEPGGAEHQVAALLRGLDPARYARTVIYFEGAGSLALELRAQGVTVVPLPMRFRWDLRVARPLRQFLRAHPQDIVHTHGIKAQLLGAWCRRDAHALISTEHNEESYLRRPLGRALHWWAMRRHDRLIAISDAVAAYVRKHSATGMPIERIYYGWTGVGALGSADFDRRARPGADQNLNSPRASSAGPIIGSVGRLVPQKGHDVLLRAAAGLLPSYPELRVVIAGRGPRRAALEELARRLGLEGHVEFLGFRPDAVELMRGWDVVAFPSRWEGLGVAVMEAMALGKPVVASAVGGIPELITHGEHGMLVPPEDPASLAEALEAMLGDRTQASAFGEAARRRIEAFSVDRAVASYAALYERMAGPKRIQIALLTESTAKSGPRVYLLALARHLLADGRFDVTLMCSTRRDPSFAADLEQLRARGVRVRHVDLHRSIRPWCDLAALASLTRQLRQGRFVIAHTFSSKAGFLGRLAAKLSGVPVIVHTPHCYAFTHTDISRWSRRLYIRLERLASAWTTMSIAVSESQRLDAVRLGVVEAERILTIPNGIDTTRFHVNGLDVAQVRRRFGLPADRPVVGTIGVLETSKNHAALLRAVARLNAHGKPVHLAIAGQGPLREQLLRLAGELGMREDVTFLGYRDDVYELLSALDVFVLSSRWEGMSYALLEAMAMERPVVATSVHGAVDLIESGTSGVLIPRADTEQLSRAMDHVLANPALAKGYGQRARLAIQASCRVEDQLAQLTGLYLRLAAGITPPPPASAPSGARDQSTAAPAPSPACAGAGCAASA